MSKHDPVKSLRQQVEKSVAQDSVIQPEEFVRPLVEEISIELVAPKIDLRSPESARASLEVIKETARQLEHYQSRIDLLRPLLEQRKFELGEGEPE